jgi:hypothetical protein
VMIPMNKARTGVKQWVNKYYNQKLLKINLQ